MLEWFIWSTDWNRGVYFKAPVDKTQEKSYFVMVMYIHIDPNTLFLARIMKVDKLELNNNKKVKCSDEDIIQEWMGNSRVKSLMPLVIVCTMVRRETHGLKQLLVLQNDHLIINYWISKERKLLIHWIE